MTKSERLVQKLKTNVQRTSIPGSIQSIPPQTYLANLADLDLRYVENIFAEADFNAFNGVDKDDTILIVSDGVVDNMGEATISQHVSAAYKDGLSPEALAKSIVASALVAGYSVKPDDTTCVVGYVCAKEK